ncbi:DUF4020 domain-containing protein, partial [Bacillus thuringiensis]
CTGEEMKQLLIEMLHKKESMKAHKEMFANVFFILLQTCQEAVLFEKEIIQIKELLVQYEVEECVLHLLENEIIRIGIVMGDLQEEL